MVAVLASPWFSALMLELPSLAMKLIGIWNQQGKLTDVELADFISTRWADGESFFHAPVVAVKAVPK